MIPFANLNSQYLSIKGELDNAIAECIAEGNFIKGKAVSDFETAFADYIGSEYCLGCGNGTDALEIILKSLNIGHGDEVIVPALTWIATAEAVSNVGAEPVFADVNPDNYTIDHTKIESKITKRTKAIIPVHLYGFPADMNEILNIAKGNNLYVVEDCAQAHGAEYFGRKVGTFGIAGAFSFFPSKNLGAFGDGGAILTNSKELADISRKIANHGQLNDKHSHFIVGRNSRLDSIQAAVLRVKLKYLDEWNLKRKEVALFYMSRLKDKTVLTLPQVTKDRKHVFHLFVIRCKNRKSLISLLDEKEIAWGLHYPKALPFLDAFRYKNHKEDEFPVSARLTDEIISIPVYPELTTMQLNIICGQLLKYENI